MTARVGDWIAALETLYPPRWAEDWDAVGLVTGDPDTSAPHALFAVDAVTATVAQAVEQGVRLLVTHHPLLLHGVNGVPVTTAKGRLVDRLVRAGVALYVAHTNADAAAPGVSDALAAALGVTDTAPLAPAPPDRGLKLAVYVPAEAVDRVVDALAMVGAGTIGEYDRCAWSVAGTGTFEARATARPAVGVAGERTEVAELRVEMVLAEHRLADAVTALRAAHPYQEPAYDVFPTVVPHARGVGRVGTLSSPTTFGDFVERVARSLPATPAGIRAAGDAAAIVRRVAVCGGAGDAFIDAAIRAGADTYVTADLRHHPVSEARERGLALVDVGHWASEWPWLSDAAGRVAGMLGAGSHTVGTTVSAIVTDPWTEGPR